MTTLIKQKDRDGLIPRLLAAELNHMTFVLKGAKGTTAVRGLSGTGKLTTLQKVYLRELSARSIRIGALLQEQIDAIEDFYLAWGSTATKERIMLRHSIARKYKAGAELTEEEMSILWPAYKRHGTTKQAHKPAGKHVLDPSKGFNQL